MDNTFDQEKDMPGFLSSSAANSAEDSFLESALYFEMAGQLEAITAKAELAEHQYQWALDQYNIIQNSFFWKATKPARLLLDACKAIVGAAARFFQDVKKDGFFSAVSKEFHSLQEKIIKKFYSIENYTIADLRKQKSAKFDRDITFSVLVPLYNTPGVFLREMIQSVQKQTYGKWELCLADGSDDAHSEVGEICLRYAKRDPRIRYQKLEKNLGISGNTNACIDMSTGNYIALFDHDDLLHPAALYEVMKAITEQDADFIYTDESIFHKKPSDAFRFHYKSDFAPDTLRSYNYICHLTTFSRELLEKAGKFSSEFDGSQDFDMILRLTEQAKKIVHIPIVLYHWRAHANSTAQNVSSKPYVTDSGILAVTQHLKRVGLEGTVSEAAVPTTYRMHYKLNGEPKVSIIIPNKDHISTLRTCIKSILSKSTYRNYEIIIVENNSTRKETFAFYESLKTIPNIKIVVWNGIFNYSAINNYGIREAATGDYYLLLNNDIEVITPDWIQEMLMYVQRPDVGAAGAMLYYPDDTIQHAGVILGIGNIAGHSHRFFKRGSNGYLFRTVLAQDLSAVTAACMMVRKEVWEEIGGLDESFQVAFNDVDLCMRIRRAGYLIVWTPYAELYHFESKSRGPENTPEKKERYNGEVQRFQRRWAKELDAGDPYYNPNLTLKAEDFSPKN